MKRFFWIAALSWLAINLLTLTGYPAVWVDEILSADAGIHLAQGKGFVSAGWFNQPSWEFWASYPPLYAFLLAGWLKLFGISAFAVRSFGFALITASLCITWLCLRRLADPAVAWLVVAALAFSEPLAFLQRAGRPDSVSVLLFCATAFVLTSHPWRFQSLALFSLGVLAVPAALQYAAFILLLGALSHIWFQPFTKKEILLWLGGAACGSALLAALYASHHALRIFLQSTVASKHSSAGRLLQHLFLKNDSVPFVLSDIATAPLRDWATPAVLLCGVLVWLYARQLKHHSARKLSSFGVTCAILIPLAIQILGKYPIYYAYMGAIPAAIAVLSACWLLDSKARFAAVITVALLFVGGTGRFWYQAHSQGDQALLPFDPPISANDTVMADYPAYYTLLGKTRELFAVGYAGGKLMPQVPGEQAQRVTTLLVRDSLFSEVTKKLGGQWERVGELSVSRNGMPTHRIVIDDDTRNPRSESIGIYHRNKNLNASGDR